MVRKEAVTSNSIEKCQMEALRLTRKTYVRLPTKPNRPVLASQNGLVQYPKLEMKIDLNVIEHLGLKMYTSLPAVIAEYVANSWDGGATLVEITIPPSEVKDDYAITIADNGFGMDVEEVNQKFLVVGRNRREEEGTDWVKDINGEVRMVIGRKGLGKLAGFGVAGVVVVKTVKDGRYIEFVMDYDAMRSRVEQEGKFVKTTYSPTVIGYGETSDPSGTTVFLKKLKRKRPVDLESVRRGLARHFSILGRSFVVRVNGIEVTPADRQLKEECEFIWPIDEAIDDSGRLKVKGWLGTMKQTVPKEVERGIVVMARGKLVQTPTTFDVGGTGFTGMHALAYLVGEIHADFLDEDQDLIATGRREVVWEAEDAQKLRQWANEKIKQVCREWVEKRRERKMSRLKETAVYKDRIANLPPRERRIVESFLKGLAEREYVQEEVLESVADVLAYGVQYKAFIDLVETLDSTGVHDVQMLVKFFNEWEVLDAVELAHVVEGRVHAIDKFQKLLESNAREVPDLHEFLVDNPWLLDPRWEYLHEEVRISKLLREELKDDEGDGRIDILCLGYGSTLNVIELKRPSLRLSREHLEQVEYYVDKLRSESTSDPEVSYRAVVGYLIVGEIPNVASTLEKVRRLSGSQIFVRTYDELAEVARRVYKQEIEVLRRKNERLKDSRLRESLDRLQQFLSRQNHSDDGNEAPNSSVS